VTRLGSRLDRLEEASGGGDKLPFMVATQTSEGLYDVGNGRLLTEAEFGEYSAGVGFCIVIVRRAELSDARS